MYLKYNMFKRIRKGRCFMNTQSNVIQLNSKEEKNVWSCLSTFLSRTEQNSKNTRLAYERAIRDFFKTMRNKDIEHLVESDLIFKKSQIETYQVSLRDKFKSTTVNMKMSALKRTYTKLQDYGFDVQPSWFDLDRYSEHDKESYDSLTLEEVQEAIELLSKTRKGEEKSLFVEMAFVTAFRKESIRSMTFDNIYNRDGEWVVEVIDKGNKKVSSKITQDFYNRLMSFKAKEDKDSSERIFILTNRTIGRMIEYMRDNMDFGQRNIVFHSLKKASIEEVALRTGNDLKAMQAQGHHANIQTTLDHYMSNKTIDDMTAVDMKYEPPVEEFEDMSKEELVSMLKNAPRDIQIKLLMQEGKME